MIALFITVAAQDISLASSAVAIVGLGRAATRSAIRVAHRGTRLTRAALSIAALDIVAARVATVGPGTHVRSAHASRPWLVAQAWQSQREMTGESALSPRQHPHPSYTLVVDLRWHLANGGSRGLFAALSSV